MREVGRNGQTQRENDRESERMTRGTEGVRKKERGRRNREREIEKECVR